MIISKITCLMLLGFSLFLGAQAFSFKNVEMLTSKTFAEKVYGSKHVWTVLAYAPWCGHCKSFKPEYQKMADNMKGLIKVAAIDCDVEKQLCGQLGIQGFPTIKVFPSEQKAVKGGFTKEAIPYEGARTAGSLSKFAERLVPNLSTKIVESTSLPEDMPSAILFSPKTKVSLLWKALAVELDGRMAFFHSPDANIAKEYEVTPTGLTVVVGEELRKYEGKLAFADILKFLKQHANKATGATAAAEPEEEEEKFELIELKSQKQFEELCLKKREKRGFCGIAALDPLDPDQTSFKKALAFLEKLTPTYGKRMISMFFVDGPSQFAFLEKLPDFSIDFPGFVTLMPSKKAYIPMVSSFTETSVKAHFDNILRGDKSLRISTVKSFPEIVKPVEMNLEDEL